MRSACQGRWALAILSLVAAGCHREGPAFLPTWSAAQPIYVPRAGSSNGYDALVLASMDVQHKVSDKYLDRVWFTPGKRDEALKQASPVLTRVAGAVQRPVDFEFSPHGPFDPSSNDRGWRMIGRALVWRIETEEANGNYDGAIADQITATKFGFSLTGGDAMDASLGFATVDDARKALAQNMSLMGAGQLNNLSAGLQRALDARPPLTKTFEHEKQNMLRSVQYVQDSFLRNDFTDLKKQLGADVRDTLSYLRDLREKSSRKQAAYFEGFADEANQRAQWLAAVSELPLSERNHDPGLSFAKDRPWKTLSKNFFTAGEPLLAMRDETIAKTRLMILEARLLAMVKAGQTPPRDLSGFDKDLTTDPYTGQEFVYHAAGTEFTVYSVGEDLKDDGGSDPSKDLVLEVNAG
jgi:hypothetical protein